ncbi:hypothetical protein BpHYR1_036382 [Brachionus plicatilis]|uniref:Uncharacterized protein n=1 Tax=Brachionus plicatilis TaxID=10195 RepID=A0A3M7SP53_BRAPC|nr:hypothetical protein BpHYR1_036382 [Brachionus plicatilis]
MMQSFIFHSICFLQKFQSEEDQKLPSYGSLSHIKHFDLSFGKITGKQSFYAIVNKTKIKKHYFIINFNSCFDQAKNYNLDCIIQKTLNVVKKALSKHAKPVPCDLCGELMKNTKDTKKFLQSTCGLKNLFPNKKLETPTTEIKKRKWPTDREYQQYLANKSKYWRLMRAIQGFSVQILTWT